MARSSKPKPPMADLLELDLDPFAEEEELAPEPEKSAAVSAPTPAPVRNGEERNAMTVLPSALPLVPIRDSVYFPHMLFPLFIGRDRSVMAVETAMEQGDRYILLAAQRQVTVEDPDPEDIYPVFHELFSASDQAA